MKNKMKVKAEKYDENFKSKYPGAHEKSKKYLKTFKDVWSETFPADISKAKNKMDMRKERAKLAKEFEEK